MASKTAGAAEKTNGGSGKMEDMAGKTDVMAYTADGVCDKSAPIPVAGGTRVAQLLRKRAMCKWPQNKLLGMAENATMAAVFV